MPAGAYVHLLQLDLTLKVTGLMAMKHAAIAMWQIGPGTLNATIQGALAMSAWNVSRCTWRFFTTIH